MCTRGFSKVIIHWFSLFLYYLHHKWITSFWLAAVTFGQILDHSCNKTKSLTFFISGAKTQHHRGITSFGQQEHFSWGVLVLLKFYWAPDIVEFVLGRFSHFNIAIAYSNSTFCGAWTPKFLWVHSKFQQNEHTPGWRVLHIISQFLQWAKISYYITNESFDFIMLYD